MNPWNDIIFQQIVVLIVLVLIIVALGIFGSFCGANFECLQ